MALIWLNIAIFTWALYATARRIRVENVRLWLRIPAAFISLYILSIYVLAVIGIIPEAEIRIYMRWFQLVIGAYIILESNHG